ncbi:MAG: glycerol-3-phosphate 1-O-acyltransferase PlsY [Hyphomicrobiaceae bacterium]
MDLLLSPYTLAALAAGYLLGAIPFGLILTRMAGLGDVRKIGSGNIGATNVLRTGNKGLAAATLALDALKGTAAVLLGHWIGAQGGVAILASLVAGLAAFLGHLFPVWLGFKGGKGVATYIGVLLGAAWKIALLFCAIWLAVAVATRYSSLSALMAAVAAPAAAWVMDSPALGILAALMSLLLIWKHAPNIRRLLAGEEPKIGGKGKI